ncbi:hypothetical protein OIE66_02310 [Nonomuraea sp. NBC_01738]|uniref:hypothetical protein n=1 Tax=Nonomuraea sp. NBC_01738 TaxID=2976003 RepID=UPI002E111DD6|nr:hypothetical protein OIE66_02310 [Nonomuraea sp. NBC_01738]
MIRRILRKRRPAPSLTGISMEEELALLRVELMYGLRVNREAYLRRKVDERDEVHRRISHRDAAAMLSDLRGSLERAVPRPRPSLPQQRPANVIELHASNVIDLDDRRPPSQDPSPA